MCFNVLFCFVQTAATFMFYFSERKEENEVCQVRVEADRHPRHGLRKTARLSSSQGGANPSKQSNSCSFYLWNTGLVTGVGTVRKLEWFLTKTLSLSTK